MIITVDSNIVFSAIPDNEKRSTNLRSFSKLNLKNQTPQRVSILSLNNAAGLYPLVIIEEPDEIYASLKRLHVNLCCS